MICKYCNSSMSKNKTHCLNCGANDFYSSNKKISTDDSDYFMWGIAMLIVNFVGFFLNIFLGDIVRFALHSIGAALGLLLVHTHKNPNCKQ